jgi:dihydrofolate reductase
MGKTQFLTATSIDGFIADADNSLEWLFEADSGDDSRFAEFFAGVGAMCMGATTYEWVLDHEHLLDNPAKWHEFYGDTPVWIFTHRSLPVIPGVDVQFVSGDIGPVADAMTVAAGGRNVWVVGGGELVGRFADQGRLDEVRLNVAPVFLGSGAPLLPRRLLSDRVTLTEVRQRGQSVDLIYTIGAESGSIDD